MAVLEPLWWSLFPLIYGLYMVASEIYMSTRSPPSYLPNEKPRVVGVEMLRDSELRKSKNAINAKETCSDVVFHVKS